MHNVRELAFWDRTTGNLLNKNQDLRAVNVLALSPDGETYALGEKAITLRRRTTAEVIHTLEIALWELRRMAFSPDGKRLLSVSDQGIIRFWDVASGKPVRRWADPDGQAVDLAYSPDGKSIITVNRNGGVRLWDASSGLELDRKEGTKQETDGRVDWRDFRVVWSPSGDSAVSYDGKSIQLWSVKGRRLDHILNRETQPEHLLAFSGDGRILFTASSDFQLSRWDASTGNELPPFTYGDQKGTFYPVTLSTDGRLLLAFRQDKYWLFDAISGKLSRCLGSENRYTRGVVLFPDGRTIATTNTSEGVDIWDAFTGRKLRHWDTSNVFSLAVSADGKYLAGVTGTVVHVWEVATGRELRSILDSCSDDRVAFSPNGTSLATTRSDGTVLIWDMGRLSADTPGRKDLPLVEWECRWNQLIVDTDEAVVAAEDFLIANPAMTVSSLRRFQSAEYESGRLNGLVVQLGDEREKRRHNAATELARLGLVTTPKVWECVMDRDTGTADWLQLQIARATQQRASRTTRVLERIGNVDARRLLAELARGPETSPMTTEAQAAVKRLAAKGGRNP